MTDINELIFFVVISKPWVIEGFEKKSRIRIYVNAYVNPVS